ncbi:MAG: TIGR02679 domain-containing protein [Erysipelotrichaceae bacterium]
MSSKECAEYLKTKNVSDFMNTIKKKYGSYNSFTGTVKVKENEIKDITGILGYKPEKAVKVEEFINCLNSSRFGPIDMKEVMEDYFGHKILNNMEKMMLAVERQNQLKNEMDNILKCHNSLNSVLAWADEMFYTGRYGFPIVARDKNLSIFNQVVYGLSLLNNNEFNNIPLALFASKISGNPHFLDRDSEGGKLIVYALAFINRTEYPRSAKDWKLLLKSAGIITDEIAGNVVIYNVHLQNKKELHAGAEGCYSYSEPFICSAANLKDVVSAYSDDNNIYIVENEMVFSHLQKDCNKALICTSGQLSTTAVSLIELLLESKQEIYYAGDMDPEGLMIAYGLYKLNSEYIHFWHMDKDDYLKAISNEDVNEQRMSLLNTIDAAELKETIDCLKQNKKAAYQENIIDLYLNDLKAV